MEEMTSIGAEQLRAKAAEKRKNLGLQFTRQLTTEECSAFLLNTMVPVDALSREVVKGAVHIPKEKAKGLKCICCGKFIDDSDCYIKTVTTPDGKKFFVVLCEEHYKQIMEEKKEEETMDSSSDIKAALKVLVDSLDRKPAAPVDTEAIISEATASATKSAITATMTAIQFAKEQTLAAARDQVAEAKADVESRVDALIKEAMSSMSGVSDKDRERVAEIAAASANGYLRKTMGELLKDGVIPTPLEETAEETKVAPPATGDVANIVEELESWSASVSEDAEEAVGKLKNFVSEFSYFADGVSARLVNTIVLAKDKKQALINYCDVTQMEDLPDLKEKMKSPEWGEVETALSHFKPEPVNRRFAVFYGAPGGGKTYAALAAARKTNGDGEVEVVPCSPSMDAADTLYAYRLDYRSGKRGYIETALLKAMLAGRCVVLDEINLLPMESRMFLQNVLDNKDEVNIMGVNIKIKPGFFVIGTMNIETGLGIQPLPLPLADRARTIKKFVLDDAKTAVAAGLK